MTKKEIEYLEFMRGEITVLKHVVAALVAMHPESDDLVDITKGMIVHPEENEVSEAYRRGVEGVVKVIDEMVTVAAEAEREAKEKPAGSA
jgi:hypothetical protein